MPAPRVLLGLGSNLGDREAALARAVTVLGLTAEEMRRRCGDAHEVRRQAAPAR